MFDSLGAQAIYLRSEKDDLDFLSLSQVAPKNKAAAIKTLMRRMKISAAPAEEGYADLLRVLERKPLPSVEGLVNIQRLMKSHNPKIGAVNLDEITDARLVKKLDDSGFIDKVFAAQGIKP